MKFVIANDFLIDREEIEEALERLLEPDKLGGPSDRLAAFAKRILSNPCEITNLYGDTEPVYAVDFETLEDFTDFVAAYEGEVTIYESCLKYNGKKCFMFSLGL